MNKIRLKRIINVFEKSSIQASEGLDVGIYPFYTSSQKLTKKINIKLFEGDAITMGTGGQASVNYSATPFSTSTDCFNFNTKKINTKYVYYYILSNIDLINDLGFEGMGLKHLQKDYLLNLEIPIKSDIEQRKIISYLDNISFKIDNTINDNKKIIELLEEYKTSIISKTLKLGIVNKKYKDSGVYYLGNISEKWKIGKIGRLFDIKKRIIGKEGVDVLSITQNGIKIKDISSNEGQLAADYSKYQIVEINDFAMNHMDLLTGWIDCSKYNGVTSPDYRVFNFKDEKKYDRRYYLYLFQLFYKEKVFYGLAQGVSDFGRMRLQKDQFLNMLVPIPEFEEQKEIADYLDVKCTKINKVIEYRKDIIDKLEEYKKSLIYEVMAGKKEI